MAQKRILSLVGGLRNFVAVTNAIRLVHLGVKWASSADGDPHRDVAIW